MKPISSLRLYIPVLAVLLGSARGADKWGGNPCHLVSHEGVTCSEGRGGLRYYYDVLRLRCKSFIFKGCGGNENRFISQEECEMWCPEPSEAARAINASTYSPREPSQTTVSTPITPTSQTEPPAPTSLAAHDNATYANQTWDNHQQPFFLADGQLIPPADGQLNCGSCQTAAIAAQTVRASVVQQTGNLTIGFSTSVGSTQA